MQQWLYGRQGELLFAEVGLSFWVGVDSFCGVVIDRHHPLSGHHQAGRVLAITSGRGSGPGSKPVTPAQRQSRIHRFQLAQGVTPDGRAGPLTLMLLNRATGVNEPRLRNTP